MSASFRLLPFLALLLLLVSFVLNLIGFHELRGRGGENAWLAASAPAGEEVFQAVRLVLSVQDFRDVKEMPATLMVGRWLSLVGVLLFGLLAGWYVLRNSARELALRGVLGLRVKPSVVVIQPPEQLTYIADELKGWHRWCRPVVILLSDARSVQARVFQRAGLWVMETDDTEEDRLGRCGVELAERIIIFGADSAANLALALECQRSSSGLLYGDAIHVQIEDTDLQHALVTVAPGSAASAVSGPGNMSPLHPFSLAATVVRQALGSHALTALPKEEAPDTPHPELHGGSAYVLCGEANWIEAALREILKLSIVSTAEKSRLHLVHPDARRIETRLRRLIPEWDTLHAEIHFVQSEGQEAVHVLEALEKVNWCAPERRPLNFFCMNSDEGKNLALASTLATWLMNETGCADAARVLYRASSGRVLKDSSAILAKGTTPMVQSMPKAGECLLQSVLRERQTRQASETHGSYVKLTQEDLALHSRGDALLRAFHQLSLGKREQNLSQVAHVPIKLTLLLRAFGKTESVSVEELKSLLPERQPDAEAAWPPPGWHEVWCELSQLEHLRWKNVQILGGYRAGTTRDEARRIHDCIRPVFDKEQGREIVKYDVGTLLLLPKLVAVK